ncbi:MAG: response regulator transcription factor [Sediminibacterium sp.]
MTKENEIRIALIDDHTGLREALKNFFESCDFTVVFQAENGQRGLDCMLMCDVMPHICVLDIDMPVMDGFVTAGELSKRYPKLKILAFSTHDDAMSVKEMLRAGASGYLVKGADTHEIKTAVIKLYEGGYYFSGKVENAALSYLENRGSSSLYSI